MRVNFYIRRSDLASKSMEPTSSPRAESSLFQQWRRFCDRQLRRLLEAKDDLLFQLLTAILSVLVLIIVDAGALRTAAGLLFVWLVCRYAISCWRRKSAAANKLANIADATQSSFGKYIVDTNVALWRVLLLVLLALSWELLLAEDPNRVVRTAGILLLGLLVAGPGWRHVGAAAKRGRKVVQRSIVIARRPIRRIMLAIHLPR
jgi:hypothetical protein